MCFSVLHAEFWIIEKTNLFNKWLNLILNNLNAFFKEIRCFNHIDFRSTDFLFPPLVVFLQWNQHGLIERTAYLWSVSYLSNGSFCRPTGYLGVYHSISFRVFAVFLSSTQYGICDVIITTVTFYLQSK